MAEQRAGSIQNMLYDNARNDGPVRVGDGGTVIGWTDRHAVTVIAVSRTGHRVTVQYDIARRTDSNGMSDAQRYEFERDPNGRTETFSRRRDGSLRVVGGSTRLLIGARQHYHDYSF